MVSSFRLEQNIDLHSPSGIIVVGKNFCNARLLCKNTMLSFAGAMRQKIQPV
jgi:hypothetical protein